MTSPASGLDERFAATLLCHERLRGGDVPGSDETVDALVRFWGGEPLARRRTPPRPEIGGRGPALFVSLRSQSATWHASGSGSPPGCCARRGTTGWVILFDEVELIGRYSLLQRGRAYAELAMWLSSHERRPGAAAGRSVRDDRRFRGRGPDREGRPYADPREAAREGDPRSGTRLRRWRRRGCGTSSMTCSCLSRPTTTSSITRTPR